MGGQKHAAMRADQAAKEQERAANFAQAALKSKTEKVTKPSVVTGEEDMKTVNGVDVPVRKVDGRWTYDEATPLHVGEATLCKGDVWIEGRKRFVPPKQVSQALEDIAKQGLLREKAASLASTKPKSQPAMTTKPP